MKLFEIPEIEVMALSLTDVITTSDEDIGGGDNLGPNDTEIA